jgi:hypothetical protein
MTPYPLHRSETSTKIMITLFLLFMIGSFAIALLNVYDKVGRVPNGVIERYGPDEAHDKFHTPPTTMPADQAGGIYDESVDQPPALAKANTFSALLDITHPHIFEMPLIILVLCHFLMRTRLASWAKVTIYFLSFGGVAGMLATPWLVRYASIKFAPMMTASAVALGVSALPLILVPLFDMWVPDRRRRATKISPAIANARCAAD